MPHPPKSLSHEQNEEPITSSLFLQRDSNSSNSARDGDNNNDGDNSNSNSNSSNSSGPLLSIEREQIVVKDGWLFKKGHLRRNWKRRWFVLTERSLRYYKKPPGAEKLSKQDSAGFLIMSSVSLVERESTSKRLNQFRIIMNDGTHYWLDSASQEETIRWVEDLRRIAKKSAGLDNSKSLLHRRTQSSNAISADGAASSPQSSSSISSSSSVAASTSNSGGESSPITPNRKPGHAKSLSGSSSPSSPEFSLSSSSASSSPVPSTVSDADRKKKKNFFEVFFKNRKTREELMAKNILQDPTFGAPLKELLARTNRQIPLCVELCVNHLRKFLDEEGLLRVSGSSTKIQALRVAFNDKEDQDLSSLSIASDPHVVAGTLKLYFRELPEPLLTYALYDDFLDTFQKDPLQSANTLKTVIGKLPSENYSLFKYLMCFLKDLSLKRSVNRMGPVNIATVFSPTLLLPKAGQTEPGAPKAQNAAQLSRLTTAPKGVITMAVRQYKFLFENGELEPENDDFPGSNEAGPGAGPGAVPGGMPVMSGGLPRGRMTFFNTPSLTGYPLPPAANKSDSASASGSAATATNGAGTAASAAAMANNPPQLPPPPPQLPPPPPQLPPPPSQLPPPPSAAASMPPPPLPVLPTFPPPPPALPVLPPPVPDIQPVFPPAQPEQQPPQQ